MFFHLEGKNEDYQNERYKKLSSGDTELSGYTLLKGIQDIHAEFAIIKKKREVEGAVGAIYGVLTEQLFKLESGDSEKLTDSFKKLAGQLDGLFEVIDGEDLEFGKFKEVLNDIIVIQMINKV